MNVEYLYVDPLNPPREYIEMLRKWYGEVRWGQFKKNQFEWYQQYPKYKIYAVKVDGVFVGQAAAFGANFFNNNEINELWWGVDTFLFKKYRGSGIGKRLQEQLHNDLPNFTSAAYTPINGIIKKKCGDEPIFDKETWYYGVSNYVWLMLSIAAQKKLNINLPIRGVSLYYYSWFRRRKYKEYVVSEVTIDENLVNFINRTLNSKYDFFVWRNVEYMKWKYELNPAFKYQLLAFSNKGRMEAVLGFTDIHQYGLGEKKVSGVKVLDLVISMDSRLTVKDMLTYIADYYRKTHQSIDGVFSLQKSDWYPRIRVSRPVLSTIHADIKRPYITYLDQDMEQVM